MDFASISKLLQADAKKFQAYADAKEVIDALAAKSNLIKEIEGAIAKLQAERAKLEIAVADATQALQEIDNEGKLSKALANEEAGRIVAAAEAKAVKIASGADNSLAEIMALVEAAKLDLASIKKDVSEAKATKDKLDAQIEAIKKSLGA